MEKELKSFIEVWSVAMASLTYSYYIAPKIPRGFLRLLSLLPVLLLFFFLPLKLSSHGLCGTTSIFLSWYANFKLFLFSFDLGPLAPLPPKLLHFISISCLPIKIKQFSSKKLDQDYQNPQFLNLISLATKGVVLHFLFQLYKHRFYFNYLSSTFNISYFIEIALFPPQFILGLEILYAIYEIPPKYFLGLDLEPQFKEPLLATTIQDFWGKRWNLISSDILRHAVYNPIRDISTHVIGSRWAFSPAVLITFFVSGLMHEVLYWHLTHLPPTGEATLYFVMHGTCVAVEIALKKKNVTILGQSQWIRLISRLLVLLFIEVTSFGLLFAPWLRFGMQEKLLEEYSLAVRFLKGLLY